MSIPQRTPIRSGHCGRRRMARVSMLFVFTLCTMLCRERAEAQTDDHPVPALDSLLNIRIARPTEYLLVTTGSRYAQSVDEVPAPVTVITAEEIQRYGYRTLAEVLQNEKDFFLTNPRTYLAAGWRGFNGPTYFNDRLLVQINGHPVNDEFYGQSRIGYDLGVDMRLVDRIEIVRGAASSLYGTNAMLGVINVILKKGRALGGLEAHVDGGSNHTYDALVVYGQEYAGGLDLSAGAGYYTTAGEEVYFPAFDAPETNRGRALNLDWERAASGYAGLSYRGLAISAQTFSRERGIPTAAWDSKFNDPRMACTDQSAYIDLRYDLPLSNMLGLQLRNSWNYYFYQAAYPTEEALDLELNQQYWASAEAQLHGEFFPNSYTILGVEAIRDIQDHYQYDNDLGDHYADIDVPRTRFSMYAQNEWALTPRLLFNAGVRFDGCSEHHSDHVSPRLSFRYAPFDGATLKMSFGDAFRHPSMFETMYFDPVLNYLPNTALEPELYRCVDVSWQQELTRGITAQVGSYYGAILDLIEYVYDPQDSSSLNRNVGKVNLFGLDCSIKGRLNEWLGAYASVAWQQAERAAQTVDSTEGRELNMPSVLVRAGLNITPHSALSAALQFRYESDRRTLAGPETPPFFVTDLHLTTGPFWDALRVSLKIRNLFDTAYDLPGGLEHRMTSLPQERRNVLLSFSLIP
jgi:outer membrane receptor for ferrienterochelin and colicins